MVDSAHTRSEQCESTRRISKARGYLQPLNEIQCQTSREDWVAGFRVESGCDCDIEISHPDQLEGIEAFELSATQSCASFVGIDSKIRIRINDLQDAADRYDTFCMYRRFMPNAKCHGLLTANQKATDLLD